MGKRYPDLQPDQIAFIGEQHLFFTATAAPGARVNLSPKGMDSLEVLSPTHILWLNLTGSGNETAAHLALDPRITLMWCSFTARPLILRAYGTARAVHRATLTGPPFRHSSPTSPARGRSSMSPSTSSNPPADLPSPSWTSARTVRS